MSDPHLTSSCHLAVASCHSAIYGKAELLLGHFGGGFARETIAETFSKGPRSCSDGRDDCALAVCRYLRHLRRRCHLVDVDSAAQG